MIVKYKLTYLSCLALYFLAAVVPRTLAVYSWGHPRTCSRADDVYKLAATYCGPITFIPLSSHSCRYTPLKDILCRFHIPI